MNERNHAGVATPAGQPSSAGSITRRIFIGAASAATAGALAFGDWPVAQAARPGGGTTTRYPLRIPPAVSGANVDLRAAAGSFDLGGGKISQALAYNGLVPGPTVVASTGDTVTVNFSNGLTEESTVHHHGLVVPPDVDGGPHYAVAPGSGYLYQFPIIQRAALNWYHPHAHMLTGKQVNLGLAGAFIVRDAEEAALGLPSGVREVPLILRDANLDKKGNLIYNPTTSGFNGKIPLVNGTRDPRLEVEAAVYRFRVLNGSNARIFRIALASGAPLHVIGNDGGLLPSVAMVPDIEFGNGERLDVLVDFRGLANGTRLMLVDQNSGWNLLEFNVVAQTGNPGSLPTGTLSTISPLGTPVRTREFTFDGMSRINGLEYDMHRVDFQVPFGEVELWRFSTGGNAPHPVHVHGASFQVVSRSGGRGELFPWEGGWKDTVLLLDQETVEVLVRFDGYRGRYLMHCHKLEHEDMGMMSNFEVV